MKDRRGGEGRIVSGGAMERLQARRIFRTRLFENLTKFCELFVKFYEIVLNFAKICSNFVKTLQVEWEITNYNF